jgi:hypothetical protein
MAMSEPSSSDTAKAGPPKKGVSPARHAIGLVVLVAVLIVGWLEFSAKNGYNAAVTALNARSQDEEKELMTVQEAESLLGKSPDGPETVVQDSGRTFTKKTYTWHGLIKSYPLSAFYTKSTDPRLHHFETEEAKYVPEEAPRPPDLGTITNKKGRGAGLSDRLAGPGPAPKKAQGEGPDAKPTGSAPEPKKAEGDQARPPAIEPDRSTRVERWGLLAGLAGS